MIAYEVDFARYFHVILLCLDETDGFWVSQWMIANLNPTWNQFKKDFLAHFQHPDEMALLEKKIRSLNMYYSSLDVSKYTDEFTRLAYRLNWNLDEASTIYQYKQGLSKWAIDKLDAAEAATAEISNKTLGVEALGRMLKRMEANHSTSRELKNWEITCRRCHEKGHKEYQCTKQLNMKTYNSPTTPLELKKNTTSHKTKEVVDLTQEKKKEVICHYCKKPGHISPNCPDKIKATKTVALEESSVTNRLELPCTFQGYNLFGFLDTGANISVVNKDLVEKKGWKIQPKKGKVSQAMNGLSVDRIGIIHGILKLEN